MTSSDRTGNEAFGGRERAMEDALNAATGEPTIPTVPSGKVREKSWVERNLASIGILIGVISVTGAVTWGSVKIVMAQGRIETSQLAAKLETKESYQLLTKSIDRVDITITDLSKSLASLEGSVETLGKQIIQAGAGLKKTN